MLPMHVALWRITDHSCAHKARLITILPTTPVDTQPLLRGWQLNPNGVPPAIRQEDDGTMNLLDVDIWMWVQVIAPKVAAPTFKWVIWKLFQQLGHWAALVCNQHIPPLMGDTLWSSIRQPYEWGAHTASTVPIGELAIWLAEYAGIITEHAQWLKHFAAQVALGEAHNGPAWASKPKKKRRIKRFPKRLQMSRLDNELEEFTTHAQAEAAAAVNAAEPLRRSCQRIVLYQLHTSWITRWT